MTEFELAEEVEDEPEEFDLSDKFDQTDKAIAKLIDQVARLANKLDEHMKEHDAHHVAMLSKKDGSYEVPKRPHMDKFDLHDC